MLRRIGAARSRRPKTSEVAGASRMGNMLRSSPGGHRGVREPSGDVRAVMTRSMVVCHRVWSVQYTLEAEEEIM